MMILCLSNKRLKGKQQEKNSKIVFFLIKQHSKILFETSTFFIYHLQERKQNTQYTNSPQYINICEASLHHFILTFQLLLITAGETFFWKSTRKYPKKKLFFFFKQTSDDCKSPVILLLYFHYTWYQTSFSKE